MNRENLTNQILTIFSNSINFDVTTPFYVITSSVDDELGLNANDSFISINNIGEVVKYRTKEELITKLIELGDTKKYYYLKLVASDINNLDDIIEEAEEQDLSDEKLLVKLNLEILD